MPPLSGSDREKNAIPPVSGCRDVELTFGQAAGLTVFKKGGPPQAAPIAAAAARLKAIEYVCRHTERNPEVSTFLVLLHERSTFVPVRVSNHMS